MWLTFFILLIIVLGGLGSNLGAIVVTVGFVVLREGLRFVKLPGWLNPAALQQLIFGVLLIIATIFVPRGLIPERKVTYKRNYRRAESRRAQQRLR
jgi:branched-chain amino acid transport system permease protein